MSLKIIHLSDLHLGRDPKNDNEISNFRNIIARITTDYNPAETLIIITGDIVDNGGEYVQYFNAANELKALYDTDFIVWPIPGNHEYGPGGIAKLNTLKNFKKEIIDKNSEPELKGDINYPQMKEFFGHYFFALDSDEESPPEPPFFEYGRLRSYQIEKLTKLLESVDPNSKKIVFLHNHPFRFQRIIQRSHFLDPEVDVIPCMWNWKDFMDALSGIADVLLFGHQHYFVDFSGSSVSRNYDIPKILSCGKSTAGEENKEQGSVLYGFTSNCVDLRKVLKRRVYGWEITIDDSIDVQPLQYT